MATEIEPQLHSANIGIDIQMVHYPTSLKSYGTIFSHTCASRHADFPNDFTLGHKLSFVQPNPTSLFAPCLSQGLIKA